MLKYLILCLLFFITGCNERRDNFFVDYSQAQKHGEVAKGWIPEGVPSTATSINETHYVDDDNVWLTYRYTGHTPFTCSGKLVAVQLSDIKDAVVGGPGWWEDRVADFLKSTAATDKRQYICEDAGHETPSRRGILLVDYSAHEVLYMTMSANAGEISR